MAPSGHSAQFGKSWNTAYKACFPLYGDDKLDECIEAAERHLRDDSMPLYHRMLFELLLGGDLGDWWEAEDHIRRCEAIWHNTHAYHQNDPDKLVQDSLAEIHQLLDGMQREHAMKPRSMEDPRLAEYEEDGEDEQAGQEEDDDIMEGEEYVVDDDWGSDEDAMMDLGESEDLREIDADEEENKEAITEPGESKDIRETTEVDSSAKPGVEGMLPEVGVDADAKRSMPPAIAKVEDAKSEVVEVDADAKCSMPSRIVKVEDVKSEMEPSSKARKSEIDEMSAGSGLDGSAKKKPSLTSRVQQLLKRARSTTGFKGRDKDKEVKKRGSAMDLMLRLASKVSFGLAIFRKGRQEGQPGAT